MNEREREEEKKEKKKKKEETCPRSYNKPKAGF